MRNYVIELEKLKRLKWYHFKKTNIQGYVLGYDKIKGECTFTKDLKSAFKFTYKQAQIFGRENSNIFTIININTLK